MTSYAETFYDQLCQPSSSSHSSEIFPWNRLPRELQVKVLRNLNRRDLSRCRSLSREMFELIRSNWSGPRSAVMRCDEEGKSRKWIACQKRKKRDSAELTTDIKVS
ncbi:F-box domain protein [Ostertagia ostertagi]